MTREIALKAWETRRERRLLRSLRNSIRDAKSREAKKKAMGREPAPVTVTLDQLVAKVRANKFRCELTGLPFWHDDAVRSPDGKRYGPSIPSLDRINCDGPYSDRNTRIVLLSAPRPGRHR